MLSMIGFAPHPPIIIPEIGRGELSKVQRTVNGMKDLARRFKEKDPQLLIVISPHGQVMQEGPSVLTQEYLNGDFGQFGFSGIKLDMQTDRELIDLLVEETSDSSVKPVMLTDQDTRFRRGKNLDHGAMVPLYYLQKVGVSVPGVHITIGFQPYEALYQFGSDLRRAVDKRGVSTAVVASGDLSHRLTPGAPAGFSPRGSEFDQLLVNLIGDGRVNDILNIDQGLAEEAGECGLRSFIIALGMLDQEDFKPEVISYEGPFGVGYLVAALYPES
ncbi:MAG: class III extradiol dioxygenase subunit B-like domain-containing protein [Bacillota bacterium]